MTVLRALSHAWVDLKHLQLESIGHRIENFFYNETNLSGTASHLPQC